MRFSLFLEFFAFCTPTNWTLIFAYQKSIPDLYTVIKLHPLLEHHCKISEKNIKDFWASWMDKERNQQSNSFIIHNNIKTTYLKLVGCNNHQMLWGMPHQDMDQIISNVQL